MLPSMTLIVTLVNGDEACDADADADADVGGCVGRSQRENDNAEFDAHFPIFGQLSRGFLTLGF